MESIAFSGRTFTVLFPDLLRPMSVVERADLLASIEAGGVRAPVLVDEEGGIIDGINRLSLAAELGLPAERVPIQVVRGLTFEQKQRMCLDLNTARRHLTPEEVRESRTNAEKRDDVDAAIITDPARSNRSIAEELKVSLDLVNRRRKELEATERIVQSSERTGADGRTINTTNIGKRPAEPATAIAPVPAPVPPPPVTPPVTQPVILPPVQAEAMGGKERLIPSQPAAVSVPPAPVDPPAPPVATAGDPSVDEDEEKYEEEEHNPVEPVPVSLPVVTPEPEPEKDPEYITLEAWEAMHPDEALTLLCEQSPPHNNSGSKSMNRQDNDSIEWAQWSWNPVTGCLHNCAFCYARDIAERFYPTKFEPTLWPTRLSAPFNFNVPAAASRDIGFKNIFTCSMADLFGKWVPTPWINAVLDVVRQCPQWNFLFLTKFPARMAQFEYPENAWLGTSIDCQARVPAAEKAFRNVKAAVKWLSLEPILEPLMIDLAIFDWVVMGGASASTQTPEWKPPRAWVLDLQRQAEQAGCRVYEKANLLDRRREYPGQPVAPPAVLPDALRYLPSLKLKEEN